MGAVASIVDVGTMVCCLTELSREDNPEVVKLVGSMIMFYAFAADYFIFGDLVRE